MGPNQADSYLRAYVGTPAAVPTESLPAGDVPVETPPATTDSESMPNTVPSAPKKEGFWHSLFDKGSGLISPGSLGAALLVLVILYLAIVPANQSGDTRLELIWDTLRGKTQLNPSSPGPVKRAEAAVSSAASGVTHFAGGVVTSAEHRIIDFERWIGGL